MAERPGINESEASGPWLGVLNATRVPPSCLQLDHYLYITPSGMHGVEDCLFINVYTPKLMEPEEGEKLFDVIVFIHGGAFMMMTSTFFQPSLLLDKDTVFVTFNYRLGSLGFMSTEDDVLPGNNGLKDQLLALKWVKKNIHAFGGNPDSVTLAGLSAGSAAVHYHILSPKSKGLFHKAIMMSGSTLNPWTQVEKANEKTRYIADMLGCPTKDSASMIKCLSERPAQHILATSRDLQRWLHHPFSPIAPIIEHKHDGAFISRKPLDIIKSQSYNDVPLLISFVDGEGIYPSSEIVQKDNLEVMKKDWDRLIPCVLEYNYTVPESRKTTIGHNIIGEYKLNLDEPQGIQNFMRARWRLKTTAPADYSYLKICSFSDCDLPFVSGCGDGRPEPAKSKTGRYVTQVVWLNNNKLTSMEFLYHFLSARIEEPLLIQWIDLSFNGILRIESELLQMKKLQILYLHCNCLDSLDEIKKLSGLKSLTILTLYGNPIEAQVDYRTKIIAQLPSLRRLDFSPVLAKERELAKMYKIFTEDIHRSSVNKVDTDEKEVSETVDDEDKTDLEEVIVEEVNDKLNKADEDEIEEEEESSDETSDDGTSDELVRNDQTDVEEEEYRLSMTSEVWDRQVYSSWCTREEVAIAKDIFRELRKYEKQYVFHYFNNK